MQLLVTRTLTKHKTWDKSVKKDKEKAFVCPHNMQNHSFFEHLLICIWLHMCVLIAYTTRTYLSKLCSAVPLVVNTAHHTFKQKIMPEILCLLMVVWFYLSVWTDLPGRLSHTHWVTLRCAVFNPVKTDLILLKGSKNRVFKQICTFTFIEASTPNQCHTCVSHRGSQNQIYSILLNLLVLKSYHNLHSLIEHFIVYLE